MYELDVREYSEGDFIEMLNTSLYDAGLGHLFCREPEAKKALKRLHQIAQHLETLEHFCRLKRQGASLVDIIDLKDECMKVIAGVSFLMEEWENDEDRLADEREAAMESQWEARNDR